MEQRHRPCRLLAPRGRRGVLQPQSTPYNPRQQPTTPRQACARGSKPSWRYGIMTTQGRLPGASHCAVTARERRHRRPARSALTQAQAQLSQSSIGGLDPHQLVESARRTDNAVNRKWVKATPPPSLCSTRRVARRPRDSSLCSPRPRALAAAVTRPQFSITGLRAGERRRRLDGVTKSEC